MADDDQPTNPPPGNPPSGPRGQTFQGLGSLRQAMQAARTTPAAPTAPTAAAPTDVQPKIDAFGRAYATGKRKNAVARVWIKPGTGQIKVNDRDSPVYFARPVLRMIINQPFVTTNRLGQFDVMCTVAGGGLSVPGRCGAPRHQQGVDLLRARPAPGPENPGDSLTRDSRVVEKAQEIRPAQGPAPAAILEALSVGSGRSTAGARRAGGQSPGFARIDRSVVARSR